MSSKMEQIIEEIEDYIDGCKPSPISRNKILVNREQLEELLSELRTKTPEEVKRYQKIISNKEAILADAQAKADQIIAQAQIQTNELVSEHQIMQQAYAQANEVVQIATKQAQEILDSATNEANNLRMSAMAYTDSQLKSIEDILTGSIETSKARYDSLISSLQQFEDVVFAACESLRKVGCEHNTADLLEKLNKIPKEDEKVREEISRTVQELHHRS